jgi:predicted RNA binding protein YcfA (HicA-like mRNA interferase family)
VSKREKLLQKFLAIPPVKDFRWDDFVTLMDQLGFDLKEQKGGSSHKYFELRESREVVIDTHRPHPSGILWGVQIKEVKEKLKELGVI